MTTITTFSTPEEAPLLRMRLESVGIRAFVQDEHMVQMYWLYSNAIGGVRVQIAPNDLEAAQEFLAADTPQSSTDTVEVRCPSCGSSETAPDERPRQMAFLSIMILNFPILVGCKQWRCDACQQLFRPTDR